VNQLTETSVLFHLGPVPITEVVVVTWGIMLLMVVGGILVARHLQRVPSRTQAAVEAVVAAVDDQIRDVIRTDPAPYRSFSGTLFTFILLANWSSVVPSLEPPTARIETDAALAMFVFVSVVVFGVRAAGVLGYLRHFASPNVFLLPLNFLETVTRSFSMLVRLFGNVMAGVVLVGVVASLMRLIVPIPLMALDLLTGAIQAYIFSILALVFVADAVGGGRAGDTGKGVE
jgi:F-type H+-transporting ATPase subunit a